MTTPTRIPTAQERRTIAARAMMPEKTVRAAYQDPTGRKPSTLARVIQAAVDLGLPPPVLPSHPEEQAA